MKTDEIREKYLEFFVGKGHTACTSDVLVPKWDNTVFFTPAGMNPFKDHFLGKIELEFTRATSCQKCLRTGDIENVGRTAYHHTFFEMLGNFSFGDYFKTEAIQWAWEFLTDKKWLGIDGNRLTVTVYDDDDEAAEIWHQQIGLPLERITRMGEDDNFWPAGAPSKGPNGVCGPCSEIFFHPDNGPECEIWNLVFTQFERQGNPPDNLSPLPSKNIDTGMGLERIASMLQGKKTNYHIDTLLPLVEACAEVCGRKYEADGEDGRRLRRIADHVRACTMAIHENVYPGPQKEESVIRKLLRRAELQGHQMGLREPFLYQLVPAVVDVLGKPYPEIRGTAERVAQVIEGEERGFLNTLDSSLPSFEKVFSEMENSGTKLVPGDKAAKLYQERGIPAEVFASIAAERGFEFDWDGYATAMGEHGGDSGDKPVGVMGNDGPIDAIKSEVKKTEFLGYSSTQSSSNVVGLIAGESRVQKATTDHTDTILVLDQTPFYAESGGQVADQGEIKTSSGTFSVTDVQKSGDLFLHHGHVSHGTISVGDSVEVHVDETRRKAIERAHSATHILHFALQKFVGQDALQRGSKVEEDHLRFDFSNMDALTEEQLEKIESEATQRIDESAEIKAEILPLEAAREQGAMMLFGEKYPDPVRMVSIGDYSKELCGGTHLANTSEIQKFEITSEENMGAGTRRIVALTGHKAEEVQQAISSMAEQLAQDLNTPIDHLCHQVERVSKRLKGLKKQVATGKAPVADQVQSPPANSNESLGYYQIREEVRKAAMLLNVPAMDVGNRVQSMQNEIAQLEKQIQEMASTEKVSADSLIESAEKIGDIQVICQQLHHSNPNIMRTLIDQIRKKTGPVVVFLATAVSADKVVLVAGISRELIEKGISAGNWVREIAPVVGGGGGGKPDLAQAGGKQPEKIKEALVAATEYMKSQVAV